MSRVFALIFVLSVAAAGTVLADTIRKETMVSEHKTRTFYTFAPDNLDRTKLAPLIVVLHGSGDSGLMPIKRWRDLATKEGIIIVGPNASNRQMWRIPEDAPGFIYELVESLKKKYPIDPRRVYLFGHSGGAIVALYLALLESEYFAAAAIHAGAMRPEDTAIIDRAKRKIPFSLFVGTEDPLFPLRDVRETRSMLTTRGFSADLTEIKGHTHDYRERSGEINTMIWNFFKQQCLDSEPEYQRYNWKNVKTPIQGLSEESKLVEPHDFLQELLHF